MKIIQPGVLATLPALAIIKDVNSIFLDMSERCARLLGWENSEAWLGKTDFDIPCEAHHSAQEFIKLDRAAIASDKNFLSLEIQQYDSGVKLLLVERQPLVDQQNNKKGVFIYCNDLTSTHLFNSYIALYQFDKKLFNHEFKPSCYILTNDYCSLALTDKQKNCLFLLVRGKSIKEVAKFFQVSPRTIEDHIAAIGKKLNCSSKSQIIERAIDSGFLYYVPDFFQHKKFEKIF